MKVGGTRVSVGGADVAVGGADVAVGGADVAVGGFVGVFSALVGDGSEVTCIQPETRTTGETPVPLVPGSRASATDGMSVLPITSTPSAVAEMK